MAFENSYNYRLDILRKLKQEWRNTPKNWEEIKRLKEILEKMKKKYP